MRGVVVTITGKFKMPCLEITVPKGYYVVKTSKTRHVQVGDMYYSLSTPDHQGIPVLGKFESVINSPCFMEKDFKLLIRKIPDDVELIEFCRYPVLIKVPKGYHRVTDARDVLIPGDLIAYGGLRDRYKGTPIMRTRIPGVSCYGLSALGSFVAVLRHDSP